MNNLIFKLKKKEFWSRLFYIIPAIIFVYLMVSNFRDLNNLSSLGLKYWIIFLIPSLIFIYQSIRYSQIGWFLTMILYCLYLILMFIGSYEIYILTPVKYDYGTFFFYFCFILIYLVIGYVFFKMRPSKKFFK